ncbi:hypothetical protein BSM4216_1230 [Bacillus smithii]|nr:hypothetical protein BSM4216_1230 [Bacillus smithii]
MMEVKTASKDCHEPNKTGDTNENFFANSCPYPNSFLNYIRE